MENGIWALAGVVVGAGLNFVYWLMQTNTQRKREERLTRLAKLEELARMLKTDDAIIKKVTVESLRSMDMKQTWLDKGSMWDDLEMVESNILVTLYFPSADNVFEEFKKAVLGLTLEIQNLMAQGKGGAGSNLSEHYSKIRLAQSAVLTECTRIARQE